MVYRQIDKKHYERIFKYECRMELRERFPWQTPSQIKNLVDSLLEDRSRVIDDNLFIESRRQVIGFRNKVFDLYSGKVRQYHPTDYVLDPLPYDIPDDIHPDVEREFFNICAAWVGADMAGWFQDLLAYLIGVFPNGEHLWVNFFGTGKNGKSSVLNLLRALTGEDKCIDTDLKHIGKFSGDAFRGKWLVMGDDSTEYVSESATSFIKRFTGAPYLHVEKKGGAEWDEINTGKLIISTNYLITSKDRSVGWYRRIVPIPFTNRFTIDPSFDDRLARKVPHIARLLMHKAYLIKHSHTRLLQCLPERVQILKTETQMLNDRLAAFFNLWFYTTTDKEIISANGQRKTLSVTELNPQRFADLHGACMSRVYDVYCQWHEEEFGDRMNIEPSMKTFGGAHGAFMQSQAGEYYSFRRTGKGRIIELLPEFESFLSRSQRPGQGTLVKDPDAWQLPD